MSTEQPNDRCTDDQGQKSEDQFDLNLVASSMEEEKGTGKCRVCERKGLKIFLVRKSVVYKEFKGIDWEKGMDPSTFPAKLEEFKYTYRRVREGYVYLLLESSSGSLDTLAFEVTYEGALRHRPFKDIKGTRPKRLGDSCIQKGDHHKGMYVTIDTDVYKKKAWIAYSPARWSKETLDYYKKEEGERRQRMQELDLSKKQPSQINDKDGFDVYDFMDKKHLMELECNQTETSNPEVIDFSSEENKHGTDNQCSEPAKNLKQFYEQWSKDNAQGIYQKEQFNGFLKNACIKSKDNLRDPFKNNFATAHHFDALRKEDYFQRLKGENVVGLEIWDPLGLAEEIAIQRKQFQMPIVQNFLDDQIPSLSLLEKYQKNGIVDTNKLAKGENTATNNKQLSEILRKENSLDAVGSNAKLTVIPEYNQGMIFLPEDIFRDRLHERVEAGEKITEEDVRNILKEMLKERQQVIIDHFKNQLNKVDTHPLYYLAPEMCLARQQSQQIEAYKKQKENETVNEYSAKSKGYPAIFFQNYYEIKGNYQIIGNEEYASLYGGTSGVRSIDSNEDYKIYFNGFMSLQRDQEKNLFPSNQGIIKVGSKRHSLGEPIPLNLTADQKQRLAKIWKVVNDSSNITAVEYPNAAENMALPLAQEEYQEKVNSKINTEAMSSFEALNTKALESLQEYIDSFAKDYFNLCSALFFGKKTYKFWLHDVQADNSDRHLFYMFSLCQILDCNYVGNFKVSGEDEFFGLFFDDFNSCKTISKPSNQEQVYQSEVPTEKNQDIFTYLLEGDSDEALTQFNIGGGSASGCDGTQEMIYASQYPSQSDNIVNPMDRIYAVNGISNAALNHLKNNQNRTLGNVLIYHLTTLIYSKYIQGIKNQYSNSGDVKQFNRFVMSLNKSMGLFERGVIKDMSIVLVNDDGKGAINARRIQNRVGLQPLKNSNGNYEINFVGLFDNEQSAIKYQEMLDRMNLYDIDATDSLKKVVLSSTLEMTPKSRDALHDLIAKKNKMMHKLSIGQRGGSSAINIIFQAFQSIQLMQQLKASDLTDAQRQQMSRQLSFTMTYLSLEAVNGALLGVETVGLFFLKRESWYLLGKGALAKTAGIMGAVVLAVDQSLTLMEQWEAMSRGDTDAQANVIITSASLGLTVVSIILLSISFTGPIGAVVGIIMVAGLIITEILKRFFPYDNGLNWEFITAWANRTIFGHMDNAHLYPPYPITDTGRYLSNQDYYLASQNAKCVIRTDYLSLDDFHLRGLVKPSIIDDTAGHTPGGIIYNRSCHDIRLILYLPQFLKNKSDFEIRVIIEHESGVETILDYGKGINTLKNLSVQSDPAYFLKASDTVVYHKSDYEPKYADIEKYQGKTKGTSPTDPIDTMWYLDNRWYQMLEVIDRAPEISADMNQQSTEKSDDEPILMAIDQYLGRVADMKKISCYVKYWPNGKVDENDKDVMPLLMYHGT